MKIVSWNVNGIEACRGDFLKFLERSKADVVCCQEIKTETRLETPTYHQFWNTAKAPHYSGTLTLVKKKYLPISVDKQFSLSELDGPDEEGRFLLVEFEDFYVINLYAPSAWRSRYRLDYRMGWDAALRERVSKLEKPVILAGDFNVAYQPIDSYPDNPRNNPDLPKFSNEERFGFEQLLSDGFVDAFRLLYPEKEGAYTWWSPKNDCRLENRGCRLDYFLVSQEIADWVQGVTLHKNNQASDHIPISLIVKSPPYYRKVSGNNMAEMWRMIDWEKMQDRLFSMQRELSAAAHVRDWDRVHSLQEQIANSYAAKVLAVRWVVSHKSSPGVDGVTLNNDQIKMETALSLTAINYYF